MDESLDVGKGEYIPPWSAHGGEFRSTDERQKTNTVCVRSGTEGFLRPGKGWDCGDVRKEAAQTIMA
jgi:hypothetical protein